MSMTTFQCSSSWGFPEVMKFRYESLRNYSGFVFEFDKSKHTVRVESNKIRDPRIRNFSWTFDVDDDIARKIDGIVSVGRVGEINSEKKPYSTGSFWCSQVSFSDLEHGCASSTEYPFSVLDMEERLFELSDDLANSIDMDIGSADSIRIEFLSRHKTIVAIDARKGKDIRIETTANDEIRRSTIGYDESFIDDVIGSIGKSNLKGPNNIITGTEDDFSGRIIVDFGDSSFRIDIVGDRDGAWERTAQNVTRISNKFKL